MVEAEVLDTNLLFCKDELPTWEEIHKFLEKNQWEYEPRIDAALDPYWKYPVQLMNLMWMCNQLNKFLADQGINNKVFILSDKDHILTEIIREELSQQDDYIGWCFPIYTCKIPSTGQYSDFITNGYKRIDIQEYVENYTLLQLLYLNPEEELKPMCIANAKQFIDAVQWLCKPVIEYYQEPVGWKTSSTKTAPVSTCPSGFHPFV